MPCCSARLSSTENQDGELGMALLRRVLGPAFVDGQPCPKRLALLLAAVSAVSVSCAGQRIPSTFRSTISTIASPTDAALNAVRGAATYALNRPVSLEISYGGLTPQPEQGSATINGPAGSGLTVMRPPNGEQDVLYRPTVAYLRPPTGTRFPGLPVGKTWIAAGLTEPPAQSDPQWVLEVEDLNPAFFLAQVKWGAVSAAPIGARTIGHIPTTGYLVNVDIKRAAMHATGILAAPFFQAIGYEVQALRSGSRAKTTRNISVQIWLRQDGHLVQFTVAPPGDSQGSETMTVSSIGVPVPISTPPRDQIVDIAAIAPGGGAGYSTDGDADDG
jgi:hypothetical protein